MTKRTAKLTRKTRETDITVEVDLDGRGNYSIKTGMPFLDHMLDLLSRHSGIDIRLTAKGDLKVDYHHTVEDIGLTLGTAIDKALGNRSGIARYGWSVLPMDESLARAAIDLGGRPFLVYEIANRRKKILDFDLKLIEEFFRALVVQARMNLHIAQLYGDEPHHAYEAVFKAVAKAMGMACRKTGRGVPSTKGRI